MMQYWGVWFGGKIWKERRRWIRKVSSGGMGGAWRMWGLGVAEGGVGSVGGLDSDRLVLDLVLGGRRQ